MINLDNGNKTVKKSSGNIQDRVDDFPKISSNLSYEATRKIGFTENEMQKTYSNKCYGTTRSAQVNEDNVQNTYYYTNDCFEEKNNIISEENELYATINM